MRSIPWLRILAESVAIVASILLAFAIDAWWAERQIQSDIHENLIALKIELKGNLNLIDRELAYRRAVISTIEVLNHANARKFDPSPAGVDRLLGDLLWIGRSGFSTGALENTLQRGLFTHIDSGELRRLLAAMPADYENVQRFELIDAESTESQLYTYIAVEGCFNQIANSQSTLRPGIDESDLTNRPKYRVVERCDHSVLLQSDHFLGLMTQKHWNHLDVFKTLQQLRKKIEKAIVLIDQQA